MQNTIAAGQSPMVLSNLERTIRNWMEAKSETFSSLCGESFTHGEVISVHAGMLAMLLMGALVNYIGSLI